MSEDERALSEQTKHRVRSLLEALPLAAALSDKGGRLLLINKRFSHLTGYTLHELHTIPFHSLLRSPSAGSFPAQPPQSAPGMSFEARFQRKDGDGLIGEVNIEVFRYEEAHQGYVMTLRDISEERAHEISMGEEKETYQLLVENQTDLIVKFDLEYRLQFASPSFCEAFGLTARDWIGRPFLHLVHREDVEQVQEALKTVATSPPHHREHEERVRTVWGWRWFSWTARAVFNESGKAESIISVGRDITSRKEVEFALRRSEERYHRLFEEAIDGIALAKPETGILVDCNKALCRLVGRNKEELIGAQQTILHPSDPSGKELTEEFRRHRDGAFGEEISTEVITRDGEIREVIIKASMIETAEGRFLQGIFHDVTEYRRAVEKIESLAKFPEENPNPILRVSDEGKILYANEAAKRLLQAWNVRKDGDLPASYGRLAAETLHNTESVEQELTAGERIFLTLFVPVPKFGYINLYARDITERKKKEQQLNALATTDGLTGLFNRRHFIELAEKELDRSRRYRSPLSVLLFDIDHFKHVNDTYGHRAGDRVLAALGEKSRSLFRSIDLIARVGGEEFAVLMPETDTENAQRAAERFRKRIDDMRLSSEGEEITISISIGVAPQTPRVSDIELLLPHADIALYTAKQAGRNRIRTYTAE